MDLFLKGMGYSVNRNYFPGNVDNTIKNSDAAIFIYSHSKGMHYVAVHWDEAKKKYIVYNPNDGVDSFDKDFVEFRKITPIEIITISRR
jgi:hypothetical protein